jgi:hypothetical protein
MQRAMSLKIPQWYHWSLGFAYFQKREYAKAVEAIEKMDDPPNTAYLLLAACKAKVGAPIAPAEIKERLLSKDPNWTPEHLERFPFERPEDKEHYLNSLMATGI